MTELRGVFTAIATPLDKAGALNLRAVPRVAEWQYDHGVDGILVGGTNGEGPSLSVAERKALLEAFVDATGDRLVIASTGCASLADTLTLTRHAAEAGAAACLVLPPFYYRDASEQGIIDAFRQVLDAADLPVLLYSIPQVTGIAVTDTMLAVLGNHPMLAGVKESSGDWSRIEALLRDQPGLCVLPGADNLMARALAAGAPGVISGTANAFPDLVAAVNRAHEQGGDVDAAQQRLTLALELLQRVPPYAGNKHVMARRGLPRMWVRPPMVDLTTAEGAELDAAIAHAGLPLGP